MKICYRTYVGLLLFYFVWQVFSQHIEGTEKIVLLSIAGVLCTLQLIIFEIQK